MQRPLFVSYAGRMGGQPAQGWTVLTDYPQLATPADMSELAKTLEAVRAYDEGTLILLNFRRLEHS